MKIRAPTFAVGVIAAVIVAALAVDVTMIAARPLLRLFWWMSP